MIKGALSGTATQQRLTHVIGPHPKDSLLSIKSWKNSKLEELCLSEVGHQFTQASNTPFLQPPLMNHFSEANVFTKVFEVLKGTFQYPPSMNPMASHLIQVL